MNKPFHKKRWLWILLATIIPFALLVACYFGIEISAEWELERLKKEGRANGEIADRQSIRQLMLKDAGSEEAMQKWKKLLNQIHLTVNDQKKRNSFEKFRNQKVLAGLSKVEIQTTLSSIESELNQAEKLLIHHPRSSFFYVDDLYSDELATMSIDNTVNQLLISRFFNGRATICMKENQPAKAIYWWKLNFLLDREIRQSPFLVGTTIGHRAIKESALIPVHFWIKKEKLTSADLKKIQEKIKPEKCSTKLRKLLESERVFASKMTYGELGLYRNESIAAPWFPKNDILWRYQMASTLSESLSPSWKKSGQESKKSVLSFYEDKGIIDRYLHPSKEHFRIIDHYPDLIERMTIVEAERRAFLIFLAAARFRLDNGTAPESLNQLVPKYIDAIPLDPYTDKQFHYKKNGKSFSIWSVGIDLTNDGGHLQEDVNDKSEEPKDIGFRW